jgi:catechol 2,3-dioxygenase-like lactoylglutathione lyase family enzyme
MFAAVRAERARTCYSCAMSANAAPRIHGIVETVLYTDDLARATAFYRDVLGLDGVRGDGQRFQVFDAGVGRVLLLFTRGATLEPMPAPQGMIPPHDGAGPQHIAFAIDAGDFDRWRSHLRDGGIAIESETGWERGGRSLYFRDPDQHLVELVTPGIWPNY